MTTNFSHPTMHSPFGAPAIHVQTLSTAYIVQLYKNKCDVDISGSFANVDFIHRFECCETGYQFWAPADVAGDELFYQALSAAWPHYYRVSRWEYTKALTLASGAESLIEIGCGRGFFLAASEAVVGRGLGIELNSEAISNKVTAFPIESIDICELARARPGEFDVFCAFQVLEHLTRPNQLFEAALLCLKAGGLLIISTPNREFRPHELQTDAFDLPPHHVGHFDGAAFRRLAEKYAMEVVSITKEPRRFEFESVSLQTNRHIAYRIARAILCPVMNLAYRVTGEPGPNVLTALRKR